MTNNMKCYEELRAAVVRQACFDYLTVIKKPGKKIHYDTKRGVKKYDDERSITRWFRSKEFGIWCKGADGETIMAQLRENHKKGLHLRAEY